MSECFFLSVFNFSPFHSICLKLLMLSGNILPWVKQVNATSHYVLTLHFKVPECDHSHHDIDTAQTRACPRCISEIPFNDMHMRDTLNCK